MKILGSPLLLFILLIEKKNRILILLPRNKKENSIGEPGRNLNPRFSIITFHFTFIKRKIEY